MTLTKLANQLINHQNQQNIQSLKPRESFNNSQLLRIWSTAKIEHLGLLFSPLVCCRFAVSIALLDLVWEVLQDVDEVSILHMSCQIHFCRFG